jgi:beta-galactosidase
LERKKLFNENWKFTKQQVNMSLEDLEKESIRWSEVDLPHDWLIYNTNDLYETSEGWYKKSFRIEDLSNKVISICFEGVYMNSTVYVNDTVAGEWKYGYSSFEFDITKLLKLGENEVKVRVVHQSPNSRWYSGAGIYRNVWLKTTAPVHLVTDGIYIATRKETEGWYAEVETEAVSEQGNNIEAVIRHTIIDQEGLTQVQRMQNSALGNEISMDQQALFLKAPILWSLENPYLYTLKTELIVDGITVEEEVHKFGFRTICFDNKEGFFLNDIYVKLHGACQHHDLGALGAAVNKAALRRQLTILKEMGINAVRTSHNMPAVELMELADEMGILINSEAFDMWEKPKTKYDYARYFNEWCAKDVASWVRRDRNHPSIIMWSIGNEIHDTHASERGLEITKQLRDLVLLHDPKQNGLITIGSNYMYSENAQKCADELQLAGYNYAEYLYEEHHRKYPNWVIYGSETASTLQSRGIYHFPASKVVITHDDEQCSSLGNCTTGWGAKSTQKTITDDRDATYCLGQFIWTGFDYIGEPTPYTTKNSYFGQIDTAGFKKDSFYLYQAEWTDYKKSPIIHLLPYWDFNVGQLIDIRVYSNAPKTELFFNEKSMGSFEIDHHNGKQLSGEWQIPYQPGTLKAVAYDEDGNIIATDIQSSFGDAEKLVLKPDKTELQADGQDLIFVEITTVDQNGVPVANANNRVEVEVTGAGRLIGLDNGDSTDYDQYKGTSRRLFSGKLLAIIAAKLEPGDIRIKVSSKGLKDEEMILKAVPGDILPGVSAQMENRRTEPVDEVPVRKIQLTLEGVSQLNKECSTTKVTARLFPTNTTYHALDWKVVTAGGIETNIAKVLVEGNEAIVTALGDGEFRLRCSCNNGRKNPEIISELEFTISGLGKATFNPYQFVSAGLYTAGNHEFESGLLGGVSATGKGPSYIGFHGVDFGDYGSDEITIPINYWSSDPIPLEIWEGMPGEEASQPIVKTTYQVNSIWNTYQSNTFKLPRKLRGITTLCIVVYNKLDVQGFEFKHYNKAYETLLIKDNNRIYGDSYKVIETAIETIGNNVSIEFENMDFGSEGFTKIVICGRSHIERNTVQIRFSNDLGDVNQTVEFPYSEDYVEKEFSLNSVTGMQKVGFMFLPGSNFDFKWFQFVK